MSLPPTAESVVPDVVYPPLTLADPCDACGDSECQDAVGNVHRAAIASAYVRVIKGLKELLFCSHHYRKHEDALATSGWAVVTDQRDDLVVKPGVSAAS